jgi:protease II
MLIVTAENDSPVLRAGAYRFVAALQGRERADQVVILKELEQVGHIGWPTDVLLDALAYEQAFISKCLSGPGEIGTGHVKAT